ncbi:MAG: DNA-3-methyladenine glycosylase [Gemmatimonadota bacterium]|nr:DNA-3-methyladenine glycosylase [Gemmatimonadota bacterium]MDE3013004.1 DNA-3-methyladenine glycosylase [Gemmatimonadota bacterium]
MAGRLRAPGCGVRGRQWRSGAVSRTATKLTLRRPSTWRDLAPEGDRHHASFRALGANFFEHAAADVAQALLGARLISLLDGAVCVGMVVETEAYGGPGDPASHAATRSGVTKRNRAMFGPAGRAYVYRSYGVHWCLNVVTGSEGTGEAVLLRGVHPISGLDVMTARRGGRMPLAAGPGRLAQAFGVDDTLYDHPMDRAPLMLAEGWTVPECDIVTTGRVGVSAAADWPLRFYVAGSLGVSVPSAPPFDPESA